MKWSLSLIGALVVAACTYQTPVSFAPDFKVGASPQHRIEGRYVLVIDPGVEPARRIHGSGLLCSAHSFNVDISSITHDLVVQTLAQVFEEIWIVPAPSTRQKMREQNVDGVITFRVERFAPWLTFRDDTASSALTNLDVSVAVDGVSGPVFATSVMTARRGESGASCEGAADAVARSVEFAIQDALTQLVDQLVNSEELRQASSRI